MKSAHTRRTLSWPWPTQEGRIMFAVKLGIDRERSVTETLSAFIVNFVLTGLAAHEACSLFYNS